jgi:hypothetical protein
MVETINFYTTHEPTTGCHMEAHDWAMWHINNQTKTVKCRMMTHPRICHVPCHLSPYLPSQPADVIPATSACATCHPYSGDTCHPLTGPIVCRMPHQLPCVISRSCHIICMVRTACTVSLPRGTVWTIQSSPFFACLGFRIECDIFRIRSPFDEVNIWMESGRRDGCNGTGFVRF